MTYKPLINTPFTRKWLQSWLMLITGAAMLCMAFVLFITPYNIIPGGVYGLGIILHHFFPNIQVGTFGLMLDVPLLSISFIIFGPRFGVKTIIVAIITPLMMNLATHFIGSDPATMLGGSINLSDDILLSALFGGLMMGAGLGLIFKNHATSGGTDIIGMIISKYSGMTLAKSLVYVETLIVIIGLVVFGDWKLPLYSIITIFVSLKVIDYILDGGSNDKLIFIVSKKNQEIRRYIIEDLERGGTYIKSTGMYTMQDKDMIFVVVALREIALVKDFVKSIDHEAFMVVVNAHETLGDGFKTLNDKIAS